MLLLNGDCIEEMQKLIDDGVQVDSVVTDPPYHLTSIVKRFGKEDSAPAQFGTDGAYARASKGFMGKEWDGGDIAFRPETWELALKLLKPGGHLLAFSASRNYHRMAVAIEDAGFEIRDQMMWLYGSGFPKSQNVGDGWGSALKPAHEPIVMARKQLSEKSIKENVLKHGTGAINIDSCRVEGNDAKYPDTNPDFRDQGKKSKEAIGIDKLSFGQVSGAERQKAVANSSGRFPANVMHDGLQEDWARFFYCPKVSRAERNVGLDDLPDVIHKTVFKKIYRASAATREVNPIKNNHPTVKPQKLMKYLCRLVTPKDGTVLDPFMGSGSTGMAAKDEGFDFIGIEKEKEYFEIAERRIKAASPLSEFF